MTKLIISPSLLIDESEFEEQFIRASGPGGQNVNKVATAVRLRFDVRRSSLPVEVQQRLMGIGGTKITSDGVLMIDAREYRTQGQNRGAARERLVALIARAAIRPRSRRETRPSAAARERRIQAKQKQGDRKRLRSRPDED